jgi:hypothetical protein
MYRYVYIYKRGEDKEDGGWAKRDDGLHNGQGGRRATPGKKKQDKNL